MERKAPPSHKNKSGNTLPAAPVVKKSTVAKGETRKPAAVRGMKLANASSRKTASPQEVAPIAEGKETEILEELSAEEEAVAVAAAPGLAFDMKEDRATLVARFSPLVKRIAHYMMGRLPSSVQLDDVVQNGMLGLLDAMDRYQDNMGAQFATYAAQRIRGAILDGLRENDWLSRGARKKMRQIEASIAILSQQLGRPPIEQEIATYLKVPLQEYHRMLQDARGHQIVYVEDLGHEEDEGFLERHITPSEGFGDNPLDMLLEKGRRTRLVQAIDELPEREKLVVSLYYENEFNLREIGAILGVTESRVCQLHSQAVARIRAALLDTPPKKQRHNERPRL